MVSLGWLGLAPKKWNNAAKNFLTGTPEKRENVSTLLPEQQGLASQLFKAAQERGAGGAFGTTADYYRDLLGNDSADFEAFSAPQMRQFNEQIIPDLAEQFAGMGSGGLSSSGFRNAAVNAGTDLSERLGAIRANLRQQGAQGLANIGQQGLQSYSQNMVTQPGTQGFLSQIAPVVGTAIAGPLGGMIASGAQNLFSGQGNSIGANSSPYGSPGISRQNQLPTFMQGYKGF